MAALGCAVCQSTLPGDTAFCALKCGHCYHSVCINTWLNRSATCPECRAPVKDRRQIRALVGVSLLSEVQATQQHPPPTTDDQQQQVHHLQQELAEALRQLAELGQHAQALADASEELEAVQADLSRQLKQSKHRCKELEQKRQQDAEVLIAVNTELTNLKEVHCIRAQKVEQLRRQLEEQQRLRRRAEADARQLRLQNPSLSLQAMQQLVSPQEQELTLLGTEQLLAILAQRNTQLKDAQACVARLQVDMKQQQLAAETRLAATHSKLQALQAHAAKQQQEHMRQVLELEYASDKLLQTNKALNQELQDIRGVLLALQGNSAATSACRQPEQQQQHSAFGQQSRLTAAAVKPTGSQPPLASTQCTSPLQQQQQQHEEGQDTEDPLADDLATALGPSSLMSRSAQLAQAPSFRKSAVGAGAAGGLVQGQLLRHGPDGRGSTARHLGPNKKTGISKPAPKGKLSKAAGGGSSSITRFFAHVQ